MKSTVLRSAIVFILGMGIASQNCPGVETGSDYSLFSVSKFDNGVSWYTHEDDNLIGCQELRIIVRGGIAQEGAARSGLSTLFARVVQEAFYDEFRDINPACMPVFTIAIYPDATVYRMSFGEGASQSLMADIGSFWSSFFSGKFFEEERVIRNRDFICKEQPFAEEVQRPFAETRMVFHEGKYGNVHVQRPSRYVEKFSYHVLQRIFESWYAPDRVVGIWVSNVKGSSVGFANGFKLIPTPDVSGLHKDREVKPVKLVQTLLPPYFNLYEKSPGGSDLDGYVEVSFFKTSLDNPMVDGVGYWREHTKKILRAQQMELVLSQRLAEIEAASASGMSFSSPSISFEKFAQDLSAQIVKVRLGVKNFSLALATFITCYNKLCQEQESVVDEVEDAHLLMEDVIAKQCQLVEASTSEYVKEAEQLLMFSYEPLKRYHLMADFISSVDSDLGAKAVIAPLAVPGLGLSMTMEVGLLSTLLSDTITITDTTSGIDQYMKAFEEYIVHLITRSIEPEIVDNPGNA